MVFVFYFLFFIFTTLPYNLSSVPGSTVELWGEPRFGALCTVPQTVAAFLLWCRGGWAVSALAFPCPPGTWSSSSHRGVVCRQDTSNLASVPSEGRRLPTGGVCVVRGCVICPAE